MLEAHRCLLLLPTSTTPHRFPHSTLHLTARVVQFLTHTLAPRSVSPTPLHRFTGKRRHRPATCGGHASSSHTYKQDLALITLTSTRLRTLPVLTQHK